MNTFNPKPGDPTQPQAASAEWKKPLEKKPGVFIDFLEDYLYFPSKDLKEAVDKFRGDVKVVVKNHREIPNDLPLADFAVDTLEEAGYLEKGKVSHKVWTDEADRALDQVLEDFQNKQ